MNGAYFSGIGVVDGSLSGILKLDRVLVMEGKEIEQC